MIVSAPTHSSSTNKDYESKALDRSKKGELAEKSVILKSAVISDVINYKSRGVIKRSIPETLDAGSCPPGLHRLGMLCQGVLG